MSKGFLVDNGYSRERKWGNFVGDLNYIGLSSGVSYVTALIPYAGPFLAVGATFGFDLLWKGEWKLDVFGWHVPGLKIKGQSIDAWIKDWLTKLFGG